MKQRTSLWWGPPRKFVPQIDLRKISWLELFFDLVYVIAVSRATHFFAAHPGWAGLADYLYFFIMIFWGWLNGSMYHDLHGSPGIRTRFMTLWQMLAVAALVVCLDSPGETHAHRTTVALMVMQLFITYLWWSVGFYDKAHRVYSRKYVACFLLATGLLFLTLYPSVPYKKILPWLALILNYLPAFLVIRTLRKKNQDFSLSSNMVERLGLFTIIVFGECVLGVINGGSHIELNGWSDWLSFAAGILVVFALWWIFFSLIADRECRPGFLQANLVQITYAFTLGSLGIIGASFTGLFSIDGTEHITRAGFGVALCLFLWGIVALSGLLLYPSEYDDAKKRCASC